MHPVLVGTMQVVGSLEIPVRVYSAKEEREGGATLLCAKCLSPVQFRRWCPACGVELDPEQVVRGVKQGRGYAAADGEGTESAARPERGIVLDAFVNPANVDLLHVEKSYFLEPVKPDVRGFRLVLRGLEVTGLAGFGRATLRTREAPVVVRPWGKILAMHTLTPPGDIRRAAQLTPAAGRVGAKDLEQMVKLIHSASAALREVYGQAGR